MRMSYQRQKEVLEMPNLIEVQKDSYKWFLDEGLKEVFDDISPIADYGGKFSLEFIDFTYDAKDAKYNIEQCKERDVTYAAPLKVRVRLINKETEEINEHWATEPEVLKMYAKHYQTGEVIPDEIIEKILQQKQFLNYMREHLS